MLVDHHARADQRHPRPLLAVLLDVARGLGRDEYRHHRLRLAVDLRQVGREVEGVERHPELLHDPAAVVLEHLLEAGDLFVAERVVHRHGDHALVREDARRVVTERMHWLTRREVRAHDVLHRLAFGQIVGGREHERGQPISLDRTGQRVADVGEQNAREHVDLVVRDELSVLGLRDGGVALGVLIDQLDPAAGGLVARLFQ